jgi:hypothetical protein
MSKINKIILTDSLESDNALNLGISTSTSVNIGKIGIPINVIGPLLTSNIDATGTIKIGSATSTKLELGRSGQDTEVKGTLTFSEPTLLKNIGSDPTGSTGMVYYNSNVNKVKFYNGSVWGELGTGAALASSSGTFINCIIFHESNIQTISNSVYAQKVNDVVTLFIPKISIVVNANTNEILSNPLTIVNLQPFTNSGASVSVFVGNILCLVSLHHSGSNMRLKIKPTSNLVAGSHELGPISLTFKTNNSSLFNGAWGIAAPTVSITNSPTTTLKIAPNNVSTVTFTFSDAPDSFTLGQISGSGQPSLTVLNVTGDPKVWNATFTAPNSSNFTSHFITIAPRVFTVNSVTNASQTDLTINSDTNIPGINTNIPNTTGVSVSSDLVITFDEVVNVVVGKNILIFKKNNPNSSYRTIILTDGQITGSGTNTITINQTSNMDDNTEYFVKIDPGSFTDVSGNAHGGIISDTQWTFTVGNIITAFITPHNLTSNTSDSSFITSGTGLFNSGNHHPWQLFNSASITGGTAGAGWTDYHIVTGVYVGSNTFNPTNGLNDGSGAGGGTLKINLGSIKTFNTYKLMGSISHSKYYPHSWVLYTSLTDNNYTAVSTITNRNLSSGPPNYDSDITISNTNCQFIVLHILKTQGPDSGGLAGMAQMDFSFV